MYNQNRRKWCKFVSTFLFNDTYGLPVLKMDSKCANQIFYVCLVYQQTICAKYGLETLFSPNDGICKYLLDMKFVSTKNAFWEMNNNKWRNWCKFVPPFLFNNSYGIPVRTKDTK
jgi:hypothetical protein